MTEARKRWLAVRNTPRDLWRRLGRLVWSGGTYVRERTNVAENLRLARFQATCNGNHSRRREKETT